MGRWINRDPIGERGGFNLYSPSSNNITNEIDILGLFPEFTEDVLYTAKRGRQAHSLIFMYLKSRFPERNLIFDTMLSFSFRGRPDVIDEDTCELWEIKTINHVHKYHEVDYAQVLEYIERSENGMLHLSNAAYLIQSQGIGVGYIYDWGEEFGVSLYWADHKRGFIFYKLNPTGSNRIREEIDQLIEALKKGPDIKPEDMWKWLPWPGGGPVPVPK